MNKIDQSPSVTPSISEPEKAALAFVNLRHSYDTVSAVQGVDLSIAPGEVVCLLGPSGCGKTTALRLAAGLEKPTDGSVWVAGSKMADSSFCSPPEERNVGLVFQDYALFPHLTVGKNVAFGISDISTSEQETRINDSLSQVGMTDYIDSYPHMLSGGQQQRVALARAMARNPDLILLDEPFSGLDARLRDRVRDRTLHVLKGLGAATLMVTHDAEEAMYMADRIAVMFQGEIVQVGTPAELYNRPMNSFVAEFFGDVNRLSYPVIENKVSTPLGEFAVGESLHGESKSGNVEVIIRPEAIHLEPTDIVSNEDAIALGTGYAKVLAARLLGRTSLIHLCTCETTGQELHLHARVSGQYLPEEGSIQKLSLDQNQVFFFPVEKA